MGGGSGSSSTTGGTNNTIAPEKLQGISTPNLFGAAQQYMPSSYFGNQPISDPTAILNAYMMHLPAFLQAAQSSNTTAPVTSNSLYSAPKAIHQLQRDDEWSMNRGPRPNRERY